MQSLQVVRIKLKFYFIFIFHERVKSLHPHMQLSQVDALCIPMYCSMQALYLNCRGGPSANELR
jgi:hypothetical protein